MITGGALSNFSSASCAIGTYAPVAALCTWIFAQFSSVARGPRGNASWIVH